jgi:3-methylfumaryl-CoA hydratase
MDPDNRPVREQLNLDRLKSWIGRSEVRADEVAQAPVRAMSATLDHVPLADLTGYALPALWHWLYFLSATTTSALAIDGHAKKGGFLPPVPLSRRMWAGGRVEIMAPLTVGDSIQRISTIEDVKHKSGASGELVFVTLNHEIYKGAQLAIRERQDLVYRDAPKSDPPRSRLIQPPARALWSRTVKPTPVLLFRYSALTFNAHRIHYDRDYAIDVDGYGDRVVHGPLVASLLLDLLVETFPGVEINRFDYRGIRPLLATAAFEVQGCFAKGGPEEHTEKPGRKKVYLWAKDDDGWLTMNAEADITIPV